MVFTLGSIISMVNSTSDCRSRDHKFESELGHITFLEIDHAIMPMVILPLWLIQEGQLSVTGKSMCIKYLMFVLFGFKSLSAIFQSHCDSVWMWILLLTGL